MKEIMVGTTTTTVHNLFITWLNGLLNNYVAGFYDNAIKNIIDLAFIREHFSFLQEIYSEDGTTLVGFISVIPTNTSLNSVLLYHDITGKPIYYNDVNGADLFSFDENGIMNKFFENVTINLKTEDDWLNNTNSNQIECFISFEEFFGMKYPAIKVKNTGSNTIIGKGLLNVPYENMSFGSYMVETKPLGDISYYLVENTTKMVIEVDVPVLKDLNIKYVVKAGMAVQVPKTEFTEYFFTQTEILGGLKIRLVE